MLQDIRNDILKLIFSKGFIRRRRVNVAIAVFPLLYYSVVYEWEAYHNFWRNNLAMRFKNSNLNDNFRPEPTKEEHDIIMARERKNFIK